MKLWRINVSLMRCNSGGQIKVMEFHSVVGLPKTSKLAGPAGG